MNRQVSFKNLSHAVMQHSARTILGTADIVLKLWPDGEIAEATFSDGILAVLKPDELHGQPVTQIAHPDDRESLQALIHSAVRGERRAPIQIRHTDYIQAGTVGRYSAHLNGDGKNITMIGSTRSGADASTEGAAEAEIDSYQNPERAKREAAYQLIFEQSSEGLVIVNMATGLIEQANQNSAEILGTSVDTLVSSPFLWYFADDGTDVAPTDTETLTLTARSAVTHDTINVRTQIVRGLDRTILIIRLQRVDDGTSMGRDPDNTLAVQLLKQTDVSVLLTDGAGEISWSNAALGSFVGEQTVTGRPVFEVLGISQDALAPGLRTADQVGRFLTSLSSLESSLCPQKDAYLTIVPLPADDAEGYGFLLHAMTPDDDAQTEMNARDKDLLAQMIGKAPLKSLVRKSTDAIERNCIEAALRLTGNNRAAAANVLGLSRQSLYIKLHQHGLV